jgi:hypothetical protein
MPVAQDGPARSEDHRAVPLDQDGEGQIGCLAITRRKSLQKLPVGQVADCSRVE